MIWFHGEQGLVWPIGVASKYHPSKNTLSYGLSAGFDRVLYRLEDPDFWKLKVLRMRILGFLRFRKQLFENKCGLATSRPQKQMRVSINGDTPESST